MKIITDNQGWVLLLLLLGVGYMAYHKWQETKGSSTAGAAM